MSELWPIPGRSAVLRAPGKPGGVRSGWGRLGTPGNHPRSGNFSPARNHGYAGWDPCVGWAFRFQVSLSLGPGLSRLLLLQGAPWAGTPLGRKERGTPAAPPSAK